MKICIYFNAAIFRTTEWCHTDRSAFNTGSVMGKMCLYIYLFVTLNVAGNVTFTAYNRTSSVMFCWPCNVIHPHNKNQQNAMSIKIQPDATVCRYLFTAKSLYMFRMSQHPSSGVRKTVAAASGTGHNMGTATSLQRGPISNWYTSYSKTNTTKEPVPSRSCQQPVNINARHTVCTKCWG